MLNWQINPETAFTGLVNNYTRKTYLAIYALCQRYAAEIEAWMKANASWQDRTGNARQSLYTEVEALVNAIALNMDHGVEYGFWLEMSNMSNFAIIAPALDEFAPRLFADIQRLLS